jgi:hypothetical protein
MIGYSELGAEPKRRLKRFLCVVLAAAVAPNLPLTVGPKPTAERNNEFPTINMVMVHDEFKSFIIIISSENDYFGDIMRTRLSSEVKIVVSITYRLRDLPTQD